MIYIGEIYNIYFLRPSFELLGFYITEIKGKSHHEL